MVPGLGGFVTNHTEARYTGEEEGLFLPPYRTLCFNERLQVNDGLLAQSYMTAYDTSYPAALQQMEKDVECVVRELEATGTCSLENVGTLTMDIDGHVTMSSTVAAGVLTPGLHGLWSFGMESLACVVKEKEMAQRLQISMHVATMETSSDKDKEKEAEHKDVVIRLSRRWLDVGIAAAAAVVLFFGFSYFAMNDANAGADTIVAAMPMPGHMTASHKTVKKATKTVVATTDENVTDTLTTIQETQAAQSNATPDTLYSHAIVLATYVSQKNAEEFIRLLAKEGLDEGRYVKNGKVSRVLYSAYTCEADAKEALNNLRQQNTAFANAWVLEL